MFSTLCISVLLLSHCNLMSCTISSLNNTLLINILSLLAIPDCFAVIQTCKKLHKFTTNEKLWRLFCAKQFNAVFGHSYSQIDFNVNSSFFITEPKLDWIQKYNSIELPNLFETIILPQNHGWSSNPFPYLARCLTSNCSTSGPDIIMVIQTQLP